MKNKKGNVAVIAIIIVIVAITAGVIGWLFAKKTQAPEIQKAIEQPIVSEKSQTQANNSQAEKFLYKNNNDLVLYDPSAEKRQIVLTSDGLVDYDLSQDGKFIAYSLREDGFEGNSDIYLKNITAGTITRLTEKNDIASLNPKIFPDSTKIAYVRRTFNPSTKKLSDGEIWVIDSTGDVNSSKKLFGDNSKPFIKELDLDKVKDEKGKWTGEYFCISKDEIDSVKIGLYQIGPDGKNIAYWKSGFAPECSGLWQMPYFSNIDGSDFFSAKFKQQNNFMIKYIDKLEKFDWHVSQTFWFDDESFIVSNGTLPPLSEASTYYYDKDQNKKWVIYDSVKQDNSGNFSQILISDMKKISDDKFLLAYQLYFNQYDDKYFSKGKFIGDKYFVKELSLGENITPEQLSLGTPFYVSEGMEDLSNINDIKIINKDIVTYNKENTDKSLSLYIYNLEKNKGARVDNENSIDKNSK